jgi:hypothetical protein
MKTPRANSHTRPHSRGALRPSGAGIFRPEIQRAQGMPGARRARSLACKTKKHTSVVTTVTPDTPGIPYAMVYGLYRALPGDRALLSPSSAELHPPT